ncbi:hypothetical protein FQN57_006437 [Myotisia sp. PD_48]|nr:hypothetical protein FQN57_006437 [Myotisia sp. PD_48]
MNSQAHSDNVHYEDIVTCPPRPLSIDTSSPEYDFLARSPLLEHEPGLGVSGLPRIRQQPTSRALSLPITSISCSPSPTLSRSQLHTPSFGRSTYFSEGATSAGIEDLHRFPSESLHSFSFAKQPEDFLNSRQNVLKRSMGFLKDRLGWEPDEGSVTATQSQPNGDSGIQDVVEALSRTALQGLSVEIKDDGIPSNGPSTGPPDLEGSNVFDKAFGIDALVPPHTSKPNPTEYKALQDGATDRDRLNSLLVEQKIVRARGLKSAPASRRVSLRRSCTDVDTIAQQRKLITTLTDSYSSAEFLSPLSTSSFGLGSNTPGVHAHSNKWSPAAQAVFTTEAKPNWTILAANDLACLVFGVTQSEFRKISILDLIQRERRNWLASKLECRDYVTAETYSGEENPKSSGGQSKPRLFGIGNGVTAQLLSKPPARVTRRSQAGNGYTSKTEGSKARKNPNHSANKSRGVLLCGDIVPIQKRNGTTGSASLWVMEKRGGLIWVVEEIAEYAANVEFDQHGKVISVQGDIDHLSGAVSLVQGTSIFELLPRVSRCVPPTSHAPDFNKINELRHFTSLAPGSQSNIPLTLTPISGSLGYRISSFPHIAGMMVLSAKTLDIISVNSAFSAALFGYPHPEGSLVTDLLPNFDEFLSILTEQDNVPLVDGIVIPEYSFRRARALSLLRNNDSNTLPTNMRPLGLPARHRDGAELNIDIQMRVVKSESLVPEPKGLSSGHSTSEVSDVNRQVSVLEDVYALWITYSRQLHTIPPEFSMASPRGMQPPDMPTASFSPGQVTPMLSPRQGPLAESPTDENLSASLLLSQRLSEAASEPLTDRPVEPVPEVRVGPNYKDAPTKKSISDYVILEDMGEGAYGQVKLARSKRDPSKKVVLKYVTKNRILVDTWTRDRRLGTVPLEIHVLNFLRREGNRHPNIVEMEGFFEDDINYYIEMVPHGFPGMDLFDYVELRSNMDEDESRDIFGQVASAVEHLHNKASVVHRDIKDENVILDGEGRIKLIDFGSAAYIKSGPFDVFVGTIDYAAPEVLQGKPYLGKEQDVWALGILLYTIIYKENPFYNINEIMDHPLRIPFLPFSEECLDLIRRMLDRNVQTRISISEVLVHPWMRAASRIT